MRTKAAARLRKTDLECEKAMLFHALSFLEKERTCPMYSSSKHQRDIRLSTEKKQKRIAKIEDMLAAIEAELCAGT